MFSTDPGKALDDFKDYLLANLADMPDELAAPMAALYGATPLLTITEGAERLYAALLAGDAPSRSDAVEALGQMATVIAGANLRSMGAWAGPVVAWAAEQPST
jgi:hypothetical protein